jgi:hypothetical protein
MLCLIRSPLQPASNIARAKIAKTRIGLISRDQNASERSPPLVACFDLASVKKAAPAWGRIGPPNRTTDGGGRKFQSVALALDTAKRRSPSCLPMNRSVLICLHVLLIRTAHAKADREGLAIAARTIRTMTGAGGCLD